MAVRMGVRSDVLEPRPVVSLPGVWTFWADAIVGGRRLGAVDVSAFHCVSKLSGFGYGQATVVLPCGLSSEQVLRLWSWRLWAFYDGEPYWCGVPSGVTDENGASWANITLTELPGYLTKRQWDRVSSTLPPPDGGRYVETEQTTIARDIAAPVTDVGVRLTVAPGQGVFRDRTYEYLEGGNRAALLVNLSRVLQGPEFRAEYGWTPGGAPECVLHIGYPRVGGGDAGLGLEIPGGAVGYRATWDSDQLRTRTFAVGDMPEDPPEGYVRPVAVADRPQADLPRLDAVDDWPGTILQSTLEERARTEAARQAAPSLSLSGSPPEASPPLGSYRVGDDVTLRAITPLIPAGIDVPGRLTEIEVNATAGVATWEVATGMPPPRPRESLFTRLGRIDSATGQIFRSGRLNPREVGP